MTVKKLKKILSKYPDDLPVALSSDSEGNSFSLLYYLETNNIGDLDNSDVVGKSTDKVLVYIQSDRSFKAISRRLW